MNREVTKQFEVGSVQCENRTDTSGVKGGGESSIQWPLAPQSELSHPFEELRNGTGCWEDLHGFRGVPKEFGAIECDVHRKRIRATARVGDDVNELSQHKRRDGKLIAALRQRLKQLACV
jgi:hypothetical protein